MLLESAKTDWLCQKPVFYNEKTGAISYDMEEVIDYSDFHISGEGLSNYLKFGYAVYGQTLVENVKSLDCSSVIEKLPGSGIKISHLEDEAERLYNPGQTNSSEVFASIIDATRNWASSLDKDNRIILPLSGGYDSRLLAYSVRDEEKVHAYSYGLSADQRLSFEVIKAEQVAKVCGIEWQHIYLDKFLDKEYLDKWYGLYGPSVHLHGMYQMEFYDKILELEAGNNSAGKYSLLSGIIGDGWAGTVRIGDVNSLIDLPKIGYTHGMSIEEDICLYDNGIVGGKTTESAEQFFNDNKDKLKDENWRIIFAMRFKMMLLHYLLKTPQSMGMATWSPFTDPQIAMSMLNLDWSLKDQRKWQQSEFDKINLEIGWEKSKCDYNMVIDIETLRKNPLTPLNVETLSKAVKREYVEEINRQIARKPLKSLAAKPKTIQNMYNKAVKKYNHSIDEALIRYEILGSVEKMMLRAGL